MNYLVFQMDLEVGNPDGNRKIIERWLEANYNDNLDVVVLPEMWSTGYALKELKEICKVDGNQSIEFLQSLAKKFNVNLVGGSVAVLEGQDIFNRAVIVNRMGEIVHTYDKVHLVPMLDEQKFLTGGLNQVEVFELEGVKMGVIICYDLRFPEIIRDLALEGIQVLHIVAEWPLARETHWNTLLRARAIENQMYVVASNVTGAKLGVEFAGCSQIVDPWGDIVQKLDQEVGELKATLDLETVPQVRKDVPIFSSRVPLLYKFNRKSFLDEVEKMPRPEIEFTDYSNFELAPIDGKVVGLSQRVISEGSSTQEMVRILEFAPGTDTTPNGVQVHNYWEELYIVKGSIIDLTLNKIFTAGMVASRPPGMQHGPWKSTDGCIMFEVRYSK
ncbi:nitrilase-related carbon-nitrogen hydrolase [Priestia megaterium]|uniref:nitrilase-related carbon-nitrogen hydrolase n=1 Tax=Priestia megaterium TaxID=1404 RepID=UPI002E203922|nr:nitrilase-related carbon-nitrogen hydrolase [Priestia megaterium]